MIYNMNLGKSFIVSFRLRSSIKGKNLLLPFPQEISGGSHIGEMQTRAF